MLSGIPYLLVAVFAFWLGWKANAWWHRSVIKKAVDTVGFMTQKSTRVTKSLSKRAKSLYTRFFGNKDDEEKKT